jgi:hypothetical protein
MDEPEFTTDDIDYLLRRDWFVDEESIHELLWYAHYDSWDWLVANKNRYSYRIRIIIDILADQQKGKKVKDLTNEMYCIMLANDEEVRFKLLDDAWKSYKLQHNLVPPRTVLHSNYESLKKTLAFEEERYKLYSIPPMKLQGIVNNLKNELNSLNELIIKKDRDWEFAEKNNFIINGAVY